MKNYTKIIGKEVKDRYPEYGLTDQDLHIIVAASPLHDIGKIAIPDDIILKPGKLTPEEFDYMKSHTLSGSEILEMVKDACREELEKY